MPIAEDLARRGFYIPSGLSLSIKEQKIRIQNLKKFCKIICQMETSKIVAGFVKVNLCLPF